MHCWARYLLLAVVVVLGTLSMMSACGRKGPLYLPEESLRKPASAEADIPRPAPALNSTTRPDRP